jgi:signal transduction histidine kinase
MALQPEHHLHAVLDYSKIEEGKVKLSLSLVDVRSLLNNIAGLFRLSAQMSDVHLSTSIDSALPAALMLDENRLRQILNNLISNAIKFSHGGAVNVFVGHEDGANGALLIEVRDSGRGVDEEMENRLFKFYEQHRAAVMGAGLGLAICRGLVDLMHGQIGYRRTPGGGATFWVRIPAKTSAQSYILDQRTELETGQRTELETEQRPDMKTIVA